MSAAVVRDGLDRSLSRVRENEGELARLDAVAGDGDHGMGMVRGLSIAAEAAHATGDAGAGATLAAAGDAFARAAGGASGALVGTCIATIGRSLGDEDATAERLATALGEGLAAICRLGRAKPGDKTMIDTLDPFVTALAAAAAEGRTAAEAWEQALPAAREGAAATAAMVGRRGRAARLGERSRGEPDAGATSTLYILESFDDALRAASRGSR